MSRSYAYLFGWLMALGAAAQLSSCTSTDTVSPSIYLHGDLEGYVRLGSFDTVIRSNAGVVVSVEGTNFSTKTDDRGHWKIQGLTTGSYTIRMQRDSFGYIRIFDYSFVGGGSAFVPDQRMYEQVMQQVTLLSVDELGFRSVAIAGPQYVDQLVPVLVVDTDSVVVARVPEYSALTIVSAYDIRNPPFDTINLYYLTSDTTIHAFFPTTTQGAPVYCRLAMAYFGQRDHRYITQFADPYVRRTILSGVGPYSNMIRMKLK